jgi:hypothetical protein
MTNWGPFAHIPDGEIGDAELGLARDALHEFSRRAAAPMGRMVSLVGMGRDKQREAAGPIAEEVAEIAVEVWSHHFGSEPDWERGKFADDIAEMVAYRACGPDFHFGDAALKELVVAHVFDLVVQQMEIQIVGGRRDALAHRRALRPDTAGRDRRILDGERPFTGAAEEDAPAPRGM